MRLKIFFGSETGNSQDIAEKVYRYSLNLPKDYCQSTLQELNYFDFDDILQDDLFVFICSTTGQGDPPENMKIFWKTIMRKSFSKSFYFCNFAVFGLGDSKYINFNFIAKKLYRRLNQLHALELVSLGLADDQHPLGIDGEFLPWITKLWTSIGSKLRNDIDVSNLFEDCSKLINYIKYEVIDANTDLNCSVMRCPDKYSKVHIKSSVRVTSNDHFQETKLLTFKKGNLVYNIGDVLCVLPCNRHEDIDTFFKLTELNRNSIIILKSLDLSYSIPEIFPKSPVSINDIVKYCLDLNCTPRKSFFEALSTFSTHDIEKERLLELSSPSHLDELYSYCFQQRRSIIEVLQDFPNTSKELNIIQWSNILPFIRSREYSIASSPHMHGDDLSILVAVVRYKTKLHNHRIGLCSNYLSNLNSEDFIFGKVKHGTLIFPPHDSPVILISPGTGIAAFRGLISERSANASETILYFGCRFKNKDFYFSEELLKLENEGKLKLVTAFSREENCYIQKKLINHSSFIWKLIMENSGSIFICGRSIEMPQQIKDNIKLILIKEGHLTDFQANSVLIEMERKKRYQIESWS